MSSTDAGPINYAAIFPVYIGETLDGRHVWMTPMDLKVTFIKSERGGPGGVLAKYLDTMQVEYRQTIDSLNEKLYSS